jgi:hypothetical protein
MKDILGFLKQYWQAIDKKVLALTTSFMAVLVFINYSSGIERKFMSLEPFPLKFSAFFLLYTFVFGLAYLLCFLFSGERNPSERFFYFLVPAAAAIFAFKISYGGVGNLLHQQLDWPWGRYWSRFLHWPVKAIVVCGIVWGIWKLGRYERPVFGTGMKRLQLKPYFLLLLFMVPLIALAGTQQDFLHTYPKVRNIFFIIPYVNSFYPSAILFELCYGIDFFTIEFFFRGFLILGFVRYVGFNAILPMAAFYCCIHFGKPLGECISSYFGGIILGVLVYNTRTIWGGLIVHLGIAWLMELVGYWAS